VTRLRVREFAARDAAPVAALHARAYPHSRWPSLDARAAYFREVLLQNPWVDPELPSWVAEDGEGIAGFMGVIARPMRFGSRTIRVAVACQLMVDPDRPTGFAALELIRRYFSGPQDLCVADGANEASRQCWEAAGGAASPLHSLHWVRLLRPAQGALQLAASRPGLRALSVLARPFAALADACGMRVSSSQREALRPEALDAAALAAAMHELRGAFSLRPRYEAASLAWLLGQAQAKRRYGPLHGGVLRERGGRLAGWFLYYLNSEMSQVLQVGARRERSGAVLEHLFGHAREQGAVAIQGRLEPSLAQGLHGRRCLLQSRGIATLVHARDPGLLVPFFRGDALFTRLDGEWWTRFDGEPAQPAAANLSSRTSEAVKRPALTPF
jgi:hypothetical protein